MPNPVTQTATPEHEIDAVQSSHDEPIVIDNGPIELDFGARDEVLEVNGQWERVHGHFHHLLVLQTKPGGDIDLFQDQDLDDSQPLTFHLGTEAEPVVDSIAFTFSTGNGGAVTLNPGGIAFVKSNGRKLKPAGGPPLRISKIENGTKFAIDLRASSGFRSHRVSAILY
jgi:hypothetical protein